MHNDTCSGTIYVIFSFNFHPPKHGRLVQRREFELACDDVVASTPEPLTCIFKTVMTSSFLRPSTYGSLNILQHASSAGTLTGGGCCAVRHFPPFGLGRRECFQKYENRNHTALWLPHEIDLSIGLCSANFL